MRAILFPSYNTSSDLPSRGPHYTSTAQLHRGLILRLRRGFCGHPSTFSREPFGMSWAAFDGIIRFQATLAIFGNDVDKENVLSLEKKVEEVETNFAKALRTLEASENSLKPVEFQLGDTLLRLRASEDKAALKDKN